jgi:hypothetical protein
MVAIAEFLGQGLYTPSEVALYVRENPGLVSRWLLSKGGKSVVERQFKDETRFVSFLDFVQVLAIAAIRRQFKVPLQTIREGVDEARKRHKVEYPLAMKHTTHLLQREERGRRPLPDDDDENFRKYELIIQRPDESLVQLTGKHRGNFVMKEIVELYLNDVSFDPSGLAVAYTAWRQHGLEVRMDPKKRFGEPLTPSGYTAYCLAEAVKTEGSVDRAAKAYGVERTEVELAVSYLDYLRIIPRRE